jgi:putative spermidine/putrescine transport system ATP-binding protein
MPSLVLEGLTKRYGDHLAVDAVDLTVEKGEFVSLLGPSGCGKTTTLQMIAGFVEPTSGKISVDGSDLLAVRPNKRGLGIMFQSYALFPHMTAAENIAFGLDMRRIPRAESDRRVREALGLVGLSDLADRYPRRMSGGQQQRVALARALVIKPSILLLDEPLSNLDAKLREEMQIELRTIQRTVGTTTVLVTHDQAEALALSDRIVVMNKGRIEQIGRPHEVYAGPVTPFVASFLGKTNLFSGNIVLNGGRPELILDGRSFALAVPMPPGSAIARIRPERITLAGTERGGLEGRVRTRIFQGAHWLFQLDTRAGAAVVMAHNDGSTMPSEGDEVCLRWKTEDMSVLQGELP